MKLAGVWALTFFGMGVLVFGPVFRVNEEKGNRGSNSPVDSPVKTHPTQDVTVFNKKVTPQANVQNPVHSAIVDGDSGELTVGITSPQVSRSYLCGGRFA